MRFFPILSPKKNKKANKINTFLLKKHFKSTFLLGTLRCVLRKEGDNSDLKAFKFKLKKKTKHKGRFS